MAQVVHRERHQLMSVRRARSACGPGALPFSIGLIRWTRRTHRSGLTFGSGPSSGCSRRPPCWPRRSSPSSMVAILQYSVRAHIPGSLDVGGFTLANFAGDAAPALRAGLSRHRLALPADRRHQPRARLSAGLCAGPFDQSSRSSPSSSIVTVTPLFLGEVVRTYSWIVVLGNNGFVNSVLLQLGIIAQPLQLLFTVTGVTIALVHVTAAGRGGDAGGSDRAYRSRLREGGRKPRRRPGAGFLHRDAAAVGARHRRRR